MYLLLMSSQLYGIEDGNKDVSMHSDDEEAETNPDVADKVDIFDSS
jgi:hypothetical protein